MGVVPLYAVSILLSATLLFMVQPLTGKILLPVLGGSPAVWSTCMVFFQAVLLLGYVYAHALSRRVATRWQWVVHVGVLVAASVVLPLPIEVGEPGGADPRWWGLRVLAGGVGLPFFALSATAPLLQHWFSRTPDPRARDPYFLYAASNAGSLLGLFAYLLVEPVATRSAQALGWTLSFWAVAMLLAACAYVSFSRLPAEAGSHAVNRVPPEEPVGKMASTRDGLAGSRVGSQTVAWSRRVLWVVLALVPSTLLLGVTQHLATDVVSAPLLWVVPLALYLTTFIAAFSTSSGGFRPPDPPPSRALSAARYGETSPKLVVRSLRQAKAGLTPSIAGAPRPTPLRRLTRLRSLAPLSWGFGTARRWGAVAPVAVLLVLILSLAEVRYPMLLVALVHLAAFTVLAMSCHTRLAESRPDARHLTAYFAWVSLGGVLGGAAAALVAPAVFTSILEYPLALAVALFLRPQTVEADRVQTSRARRLAWRASAAALLVAGYWCVSALNEQGTSTPLSTNASFAWLQSFTTDAALAVRASLAIPAALLLFTPRTALLFAATTAGLLIGASTVRTGGDVLERDRTFFGVHQVTAIQNGAWHVLTHGTTTHGVQAVRGKLHALPTAYYHPSGPLGDIVFTLVPDGRFHDVAAIGLGAGALAAYAGNGVRMDFFEIDDAVIRIAGDPRYFTYLTDAKARPGAAVRTVAVDGRLGVRAMPEASYDLIVVDAFSSDAVPTHLMTREAVAVYESRLKPRGLIAFHVSSRFFDLAPVLARIAADRGLAGYVRNDKDVPPDKAGQAMRASVWVALARGEGDFGQIAGSAGRWARLAAQAGGPLWTDDYSNVLGVLAKQP